MMRYLFLAFVLAFMTYSVFATEPIQIPINTWSEGTAKLAICDTPEQISSVVTAHREGGLEAGSKRFLELSEEPGNGGPACGIATARFLVVQSLWSGEIDGKPGFIAELLLVLPSGMPVPISLYGAFIGAVLVGEDEADKTRL